MLHKKTNKTRSGWKDNLLPLNAETRLQAHHESLAECSSDSELLQFALYSLKFLYRDIKAPPGFSDAVLDRIKTKTKVRESSEIGGFIPTGISRVIWQHVCGSLRPVAAAALAGALIFGLGSEMIRQPMPEHYPPLLSEVPSRLIPPVLGETPEDPNIFDKKPALTLNGEQVTQASDDFQNGNFGGEGAAHPAHETENLPAIENEPVVAAQEPPDKQNGQIVNLASDEPELDEPRAAAVNFIKKPPIPISEVTDAKPVGITPFAEAKADIFREVDLPAPGVFSSRQREINSLLINMQVGTLGYASVQIAEIANIYGILPEKTFVELRDDGVLVQTLYYRISQVLADHFALRLNFAGTVTSQKRIGVDITAEYKAILDQHENLLGEVLRTGIGKQQARDIVNDLIVMNKASEPGMINVLVQLEDAVDL